MGGISTIPIDVRIIASTHQPLLELVARHKFRQDLYYRLNTLCLSLPSLRNRPNDIATLAHTLMARSLRKLGSKLDAQSVLAPLLPYLTAHSWPGNVRELENITDRISVFLLQFNNQNERSEEHTSELQSLMRT